MNISIKTMANSIYEASEKLKKLRPVVRWYHDTAIHAQEECLSEYLEASHNVIHFKYVMYMDIDNLHLYIAEQSQSAYYFAELTWNEFDPYDIAEDIRTIDGMEYVDALWLTDRVNREYLMQWLRKSIAENEERSHDMSKTIEDSIQINGDLQFYEYALYRLTNLD
jgi:hypothetical protein